MVLVKGELCFTLIILIVVVSKFVDFYQSCMRLHTIVCIRLSVIAVVVGTLNQLTSLHVVQYLQRQSVAREAERMSMTVRLRQGIKGGYDNLT
jgi:hypothetical protein